MNDREQFEAWARERGNILRSIVEGQEYQSQVTELKWQAWQACAESKQSELAALKQELFAAQQAALSEGMKAGELNQELQALREQKPVAEVKFAMQFEIAPDLSECILQNVHVGTKLYAAPVPASEWMPIETAPKDGTDVWLFLPDDEPTQAVGYFDDNGVEYQFWGYREHLVQDVQGCANPTHWKPLSAPQKAPS